VPGWGRQEAPADPSAGDQVPYRTRDGLAGFPGDTYPVLVHPGRHLAWRRRGDRGKSLGKRIVVAGQGDGLGQQRGRPFGVALGFRCFGPANDRGDLGSRGCDALVQRVLRGQADRQQLSVAQPTTGQFVLYLLTQGAEAVRGQHGRRYQASLVFVQSELVRLPGDDPLEETALDELPQPFDDLAEQQGIEIAGRAGGGAQDGQHVLAWRFGRVRVGQGGYPEAGRGDLRFPQRRAIGKAEAAENPETPADRVAEDHDGGKPDVQLVQVPGQVRLLGVRRRGQFRIRVDDRDACLAERLGDVSLAHGAAEHFE
jgi:hypothetical protein